jgi:DNA-binding NarL/FixJ family response regulator
LEELRRRRNPTVLLEPDARLTRREVETLHLMSRGLTNKEIASELHLSVATVKHHVHAVLEKLQLTRRAQASQVLHERPWLVESA